MSTPFQEGTVFLRQLTKGPVAVVMDGDADGLSGGRIVTYTLEKRNIEPVAFFLKKGDTAYSDTVVSRVKSIDPKAIILVDMGASSENPYIPIPVLVLDHHQPLGIPPNATFVSSYKNPYPETSAHIAYLACRMLVSLKEVEWLALLGIYGDLGNADSFPVIQPLVKRYSKTQLRKAVTLINAARRSQCCDVACAYQALVSSCSISDLVNHRNPHTQQLARYRKEVQIALDEALTAKPVFHQSVALVTCHSLCQIHGIIASRWARRLKGYAILSINTGFIEKKAIFSLRSMDGRNLIALLHQHLGPYENLGGIVGYGHHSATGGIIPIERLPDLLKCFSFHGHGRLLSDPEPRFQD